MCKRAVLDERVLKAFAKRERERIASIRNSKTPKLTAKDKEKIRREAEEEARLEVQTDMVLNMLAENIDVKTIGCILKLSEDEVCRIAENVGDIY